MVTIPGSTTCLALLILIVAAWQYFGTRPEPASQAAFIVPSQSVRW